MFSIESFVDQCREALQNGDPSDTVAGVLRDALSDPKGVAAAIQTASSPVRLTSAASPLLRKPRRRRLAILSSSSTTRTFILDVNGRSRGLEEG